MISAASRQPSAEFVKIPGQTVGRFDHLEAIDNSLTSHVTLLSDQLRQTLGQLLHLILQAIQEPAPPTYLRSCSPLPLTLWLPWCASYQNVLPTAFQVSASRPHSYQVFPVSQSKAAFRLTGLYLITT